MTIEKTPIITVCVVAFRIHDSALHIYLHPNNQEKVWLLPEVKLAGTKSLDSIILETIEKDIGYVQGINYKEQLYTFDISKRGSAVSGIEIAYLVLLPANDLGSRESGKKKWFLYSKLPLVNADHEKIIRYAHERLQGKLGYTNIAYGLLPYEFTLTQLQSVYEIILGKTFDKRNFRKKMLLLEILQSTGQKKRLGNNRPAEIYRFRKQELTYVDVL